MRMLEQHPNVAKLYSVYEDAVSYHLVMELCTGGELFDKVGPCSGPAAPSTCTIIAWPLCCLVSSMASSC